MLNIRELEKRWLHYKIKSYIPHAIIVISLFVIIAIVILFMTTQKQEEKTLEKNTQKKSLQTKKIIHDNSNEEKTLIEENRSTSLPIQKVQVLEKIAQTPPITSSENQQMTLTPSMNFMKHIQSEEQQPVYRTLHNEPKIHKKSKSIKRTKVTQHQNKIEEEYLDIQQQPQTKHKIIQMKQKDKLIAKPVISIERKDSEQDIKEVIRRFKKNNNPALSLFVAKKYYELGNYEQAYNYALITNGINNDIEDSWIIFAKSLVKLHKRDMALKTLAEYIKYSHSGNAKILFNDIQSGKFQ